MIWGATRMKFKTAVFDLDGTLLDTLGDLRDSVNFALEKNNLPNRTTEEIRAFVGNGIRLLIERSVPQNTPLETVDKCFNDFKEHYRDNSANLTKPYDGIIELLNILKSNNIKLAVVSNKADFAVKALVSEYFPHIFDCAFGEREGIKRKPAPDTVFAAMGEMGSALSETVYIGDSEVDIETSRNSGLPCVAVTWGFRDKSVLEELKPEYIIDKPSEISDIIFKEN